MAYGKTLAQLALQNNEYAVDGTGLVFGNADRARDIFVTELDRATAEWSTQDQDRPQRDGTAVGRDFLRGPVWRFRLVIDTANEDEALTVLDRVMAVWHDRKLARTPHATRTLVYRANGRTRRVYGRPRNIAVVDDSNRDQGVMELLAEFKLTDVLHYTDTEESVTITLVPMVVGGLKDPLMDPLTSEASGSRAGLVTVAGNGQTPFTVTFKGPGTDLAVSAPGWRVGIRGTLNYDQTAVVDTRTGLVTRNGAMVAGLLSHDTYMGDAVLQPGAQELIFEGTDATGTAQAIVSWRTAHDGF